MMKLSVTAALALLATGAALGLSATAAAAPGVVYETDTQPADPSGSASAGCPAGHKLAGGGGAISSPQLVAHPPFINSSGPFLKHWLTYGHFAGGDQWVTSYASCLRKPIGRPKAVGGAETLPANDVVLASVKCPKGTRVTGGGLIVSGAVTAASLGPTAPFDGNDPDDKNDDGWSGVAVNHSDSSLTANVTALCLREGRRKLRYAKLGFDTARVTVSCPAKTRIVSGGFSGNVHSNPIQNYPGQGGTVDPKAWTVAQFNDDSDAYGGTAHAICVKP